MPHSPHPGEMWGLHGALWGICLLLLPQGVEDSVQFEPQVNLADQWAVNWLGFT